MSQGCGDQAALRGADPRWFGLDPVRDVQVLCPMNRGGLGTKPLNIAYSNS